MALRTPPLPLDALAWVCQTYNESMKGRGYVRNMPPLSTSIQGSSFDLVRLSEGHGIRIYANRGDAEKQMYTDRVRLFTEQITTAEQEVRSAESAHKHALKMEYEADADHKAQAKARIEEKQKRLEVCRDEVVRLTACREEALEFIKNWSGHSVEEILDESVEGPLFVLMEVGAEDAKVGTPLDQVAAKIRDGDQYTIDQVRMLLPPEELSVTQVLAWMLAQDKLDKPKMTGLIRTFMEERKNADQGSALSDVQSEDSVDREPGGSDEQRDAEPVPVVSGPAIPAGDGGDATEPAKQRPRNRKR